jgi:hypothetical protein
MGGGWTVRGRNFRDFNRRFAPLHGGNRFSNVNLALNDRHFAARPASPAMSSAA